MVIAADAFAVKRNIRLSGGSFVTPNKERAISRHSGVFLGQRLDDQGIEPCVLRFLHPVMPQQALEQGFERGIVEDAAFRGDDTLLLVRLAGGAVLRVAHAEEDGAPPPRGAAVALAWDAADVVALAS